MKKHTFYYLAFLILFSVHSAAAEKITIRAGYLPILDHLPLLISHHKDGDNFQNLEVTPKLFKSWAVMSGALKAGVINAAFILSPLAMDLFNKGVPIRTVLLAHRDGSAITVKKGANILSAADLKGKNVAIPYKISTHTALLNTYLGKAGLSLRDIQTKVIAPPDMITAMSKNIVDAFIVAEPFGAKAQNTGVGEILVLTKDITPHHVECIVVVHENLLTEHPAAVKEWVGSLVRAGKFIDKDKLDNGSKETAEITAKKYWPHSQQTIVSGLQNPAERISFSDLAPVLEDFQTILKISQEAHIVKEVDLKKFIDAGFYRETAGDSP